MGCRVGFGGLGGSCVLPEVQITKEQHHDARAAFDFSPFGGNGNNGPSSVLGMGFLDEPCSDADSAGGGGGHGTEG